MLKDFFVLPRTLKKLEIGPAGPYLESFSNWLKENGYKRDATCRKLIYVARWSQYLVDQGVESLAQLRSDHVLGFSAVCEQYCEMKHPSEMMPAVHRFVHHLTELGEICLYPESEASIVGEYLDWMCEQQLSEYTQETHRRYLITFLEGLNQRGVMIEDLTSDKLLQFFQSYACEHGVGAQHSLRTTLSTFFRFCLVKQYLKQDLRRVIPPSRAYRLAKVPKGIEADEALHVITSIEQSSKTGLRDIAILSILYSYGVRGTQVRNLKLEDIDWNRNQIFFAPKKRGREIILPLTKMVGSNVLEYLQNGRPESKHREVFLTAIAPIRPLTPCYFYRIIRYRLMASGLKCRPLGSHAFRYCFATRMLGSGLSLKDISDMLGHQNVQTTFKYAKIDFQALSTLAQEWPEVR